MGSLLFHRFGNCEEVSVCTGVLLLGKAGLLDGLEATTHHGAYDLLREIAPGTRVHEDRRFVDNGTIITSAGIAAKLTGTYNFPVESTVGMTEHGKGVESEKPPKWCLFAGRWIFFR